MDTRGHNFDAHSFAYFRAYRSGGSGPKNRYFRRCGLRDIRGDWLSAAAEIRWAGASCPNVRFGIDFQRCEDQRVCAGTTWRLQAV